MKDNNYGGKAEAKSSDKSKMGVGKSKLDSQGDVKGKNEASYSKAGIQNQKKQAGAE
jgi:hypothetical protein